MPAAPHTSTEAAHKPTTAATRGATTRSTTRATRITTSTHAANSTTATATITPTPTPTPEPAGGPSGAMIGGIVGGVVVILALVGLVFYKRRQRASVAAASTSGKGSRDMMETGAGLGAGAASSKAISGPMALAPEAGIEAGPTHRPEAQFREQQQFRPGMRDELFAQPGSALHTTPSNKSKGSSHNNNNNGGNNYMQGPGPVSREIENVQRNNSHGVARNQSNSNNNNNNNGGLQNGNQAGGAAAVAAAAATDDYYDDPLDFYSQEPESIGAQRSAPPPRDLQHGNLTPAPEYYLGKEDIDPRRDLRGMDNPDTYISKSLKDSDYPHHDPRQPIGTGEKTKEPLSPRSSYSSDGEAYLTIEQAQDAHNRKIQGHKESIGSVQMLIEHSSMLSPTSTMQDPMHSAAISESTVSHMPSLPSAASPLPFTPHNNNRSQTSLPRSNGSPPSDGSGGNGRFNRPAAPPSSAPVMREDPYAESAYSEDFYDSRSLVSGGYNHSPAGGPQYNNGPGYRQHPQTPPPLRIQQNNGPYPASPGSRGSPYSPHAMSPPFHPNQGYNNNYGPRHQHPDSPSSYGGGGGRPSPNVHGYNSPSPGHGPSQYPPQNGGHHGNPGPGYRPHPSQRDPSYNNNQGPYRGAY